MANYLLWFIVALVIIVAFGILLFGFDALTFVAASLTIGGILIVVFIIAAIAAGIAFGIRALNRAGLLAPFLVVLLAPFVFMLVSVIALGQPLLDVPTLIRALFPI